MVADGNRAASGDGQEGQQEHLLRSQTQRGRDLCMVFFKIILHIFAILLCVYIEDHIGN